MSKKKASSANTMTLKDFHGGSIPSDLPLPSAPTVFIEPNKTKLKFPSSNSYQINEDEEELWVVKAITTKLIDEKMDQMNQVVVVSRYIERVFGQQQWETLRTKLSTWRGNISNVISTIQANKLTEDSFPCNAGPHDSLSCLV